MGYQTAEVEVHVDAGIGRAQAPAVERGHQRQVQLAAAPVRAQLIGRGQHRGQGRGRLGLQEAEALGDLGRDQVAQRDIVGQADQAHRAERSFCAAAQRHVTGDHHHFGLQVDAKGLVGGFDGVVRAQEVVGPALVHQRVAAQFIGRVGAARAPHQLHMVQVGRCIEPMVGARQRRRAGLGVEGFEGPLAGLQFVGDPLQCGPHAVPLVERLLQGGAFRQGTHALQVAADDDELSVAPVVSKGGKFHGNVGRRCRSVQGWMAAHISRSRTSVQILGLAMPWASS